MGRLRIQLAVSVDGFIAPPDRSFGWLEPFPANEFGFEAFLSSIGSLLMGRKSFEEVQQMGPWPYSKWPAAVLTSRPISGAANVEGVPLAGLSEKVAQLRRETKDTWLFGGGQTIAACLERHLVDTLELAVVPRLLGSGIPLFAPRAPSLESLRLVRAEKMKKDVLWLEYARPRPS